MRLPLEGIVVVELGHSVAAPFAGQVLGDLGAKVIKIENPDGGDDARGWGPPFWYGASATFQSLNRNKLSAAIDLKKPTEVESLRSFIMNEADVVLQNLRPGLSSKLGIGDSLTETCPRLIYCNLGAFGSVGPYSSKPGYDPMMQAFSGIMSITGEADRPPVRVGPSIIDIGSGMWCVIGILAAVVQRNATGQGCKVDTSLFEAALAWMTIPAAISMAAGKDQGRTGSEAAMLAPYKAYQASDKYVVIAAGNDNLFRRLCQALRKPEWVEDERFRTNSVRVTNRDDLNGQISEIVKQRTANAWLEILDAAGVPCSPIHTVSEILGHAQTEALGMLQSVPDSPMRLISVPLRFDGERPQFRSKPPTLGADTGHILKSNAPSNTAGPAEREAD